MAEKYKVLGQVYTNSVSDVALYTVPAGTSAVISTITICGVGAAGTASVRINVAGAGDNNKQFICNVLPIGIGDTVVFTLGITLATTDVINVFGDGTNNMAYQAFGCEIT